MEIYWLEQLIPDVPLSDEWLSSSEQLILAGLKVPKRRADWRLGRWTAKRAVAEYLALLCVPKQLMAIEIRPAATGAPEVFLDQQPANVSISLSHRAGTAACAIVPSGSVVGCDLELVEPRADEFISDYFTATEQKCIAHVSPEQRDRLVTILWSAKESALKALRTGLRVDTRSVVAAINDSSGHMVQCDETFGTLCASGSSDWYPLSVRYEESQVLSGWWQCTSKLARTAVSAPPASPPIPLSTLARR
jgi:4'-phosphopantetheinyl transferase